MQTWAKRGIQTALVTGGMLMLGTGIASADEDVNPDKPASPLDLEPDVASALDDATLRQPLSALQGITKDIPVVNKLVDQIAGSAAGSSDSVVVKGPAVHDTIDSAVDGTITAFGGRDDEPVSSGGLNGAAEWVAPIRVDSGSIALTGREAEAVGEVGPNHYGVLTDLRSVRELADLGMLPAWLHQAGADLIVTGHNLGNELIDVSQGLVEASENQTQDLDSGIVTGEVAVVPADQSLPAVGDTTGNTAGGMSTTSGEGGAMSGVASRAPVDLPVFDVPADVLAKALSTLTKNVGIAEGSNINLPVNRLEAVPNQLPSLLPLGRSLLRDHQPAAADPVDEVVVGVFSGVLDNATDRVADKVTSITDTVESPRILPTVAPGLTNPFGPITGDLFDTGVNGLALAGDLFSSLTGGAGTGGLSSLLPANAANRARDYLPVDLPANLPAHVPANLPAKVPANLATNLPANLTRDLSGIAPDVPSDLDVTQIVPPIPSLNDLRAPSLRGVPAMASVPAVDPGTLTDTRAALASLFTNHPIG